MGLYHYRSQPIEGGVLVSCVEMDLASEKATEAEAVAELKRALEERLRRPEAVGPPSREPEVEVELRPLSTTVREALEGARGGERGQESGRGGARGGGVVS